MADELATLDEAVAAAAARGDPLQHAYRAVALERLYKVHQRDRSSRSAVAAVFWGAYALLFWAASFLERKQATSTASLAIMLAAVVASGLALRSWSRWAAGRATKEAEANENYRKALVEARRQFIRASQAPEVEPVPTPFGLAKAKWKGLPQRAQNELLLLGGLLTLALLAATLAAKALPSDLSVFGPLTRATLIASIVVLAWTFRKESRRTKAWFDRLLGAKPSRFLHPVALAVVLSVLLVPVSAEASRWMTNALSEDFAAPSGKWGWCFVLALMLAMDVWWLLLERLRSMPSKPATTGGQ